MTNFPAWGHIRITTLSLVALLLAGGISNAGAQTQVNILDTDLFEELIIDGEQVRKLIGNVRLATDQMVMDSDSAYHYLDRHMIQAYNIQIETGEEIIWADTLFYDTTNDYSRLRGRVIIESETNRLFSEQIDYDQVFGVAIFHSPVRFEDEDGELLAQSGYYFRSTDIAFFRQDVQLADSTQYLEADSLFMNRPADFYQLFDNVYAENHQDRVTFSGRYLEADSTGFRILTGDAWMMRVNEARTDTSHMNADTIVMMERDTVSTIDAYNNVRIWSPAFSALADTVHYRDDIEEFQLISNPVAWQRRIQLTGPYIRALMENEDIHYLESYIRPIVVMEDSMTGRLNQMTGDTLKAWFTEGEIRRIDVYDNSEVIFHRKDEDDEPDGLMELMARGMSTVTFVDGDPDEFKASRNPDGSYLPEHPDNIDRRLSGFRWDPEMRPVRPVIHTPRLPEITAEPMFPYPPRYQAWLREQGRELY